MLSRCFVALSAGLMAGLGTGCFGLDPIDVDVPAEVSAAGVVLLNDDDQVVEGSSLVPWASSLPVFAPAQERSLVLGFTDRQLAPFPNLVGSPERLEAAASCSNRLPAPAFAAFLTADGLTPTDPRTVPAVTSMTVRSTCSAPQPGEGWHVDVSCFNELCRAPITGFGECSVSFDLSSCGGVGNVDVTIDADGQACAEVTGAPQSCEQVSDPYSTATLQCGTRGAIGSCTIHIYRDARERPPPFVATKKQWADRVPMEPSFLDRREWVGSRNLRSGYALAMTLLDGAVVISGPADPERGCSTEPGFFYFVDTETLDRIREVQGLPCVEAIVADDNGDTFVAVYLGASGWRIGRFNQNGEMLLGRAVGDAIRNEVLPMSPVPYWRAQALLKPPFSDELWLVMYDGRDDGQRPGVAVIRLNRSTLSEVAVDELSSWSRSYEAVMVGPRQFSLIGQSNFLVGWFSSGEEFPDFQVSVLAEDEVRNVLYSILPITPDRLVVSARGRVPALVVSKFGELKPIVHPAGQPVQAIMRLAEWDGPIKLGLGMETTIEPRREAVAMLMDTDHDRFLPGVWKIGDGMPGFVATDIRGRHFVLLPWSAEIVRIDPLP